MSIWKDARLTVKGQNISSSVRALAVELGAEAPDQTTMGDNWREGAAGGLKTAAVTGELNWAAGSTTGVDSLFGSTANLGQVVAVTIRPTTAAIGAGNPQYSGNFVVTQFTPGQGNVGDQHTATFGLTLNGALTRAIST